MAMRYAIEIVREVDGAAEVVHRANVEAITPMAARRQARTLFASWKRKQATGFAIKNPKGDEVYRWRE